MSVPLRLFDSLNRSAREFNPIEANHARVYSCGPTVYHFAHLGNLRAYVFTDTLTRVMRWKGLEVTHVVNITDVGHLTSDADAGDDKMAVAAAREAKTIWDVAKFYTEAFMNDVAALNIRAPSRWSVATDHVQEMIAFAERIELKHCYELETGLYFDSSTVPDYGRLAGHGDGPQASRITEVDGKRHSSDFAIWRKSPSGEQRQMEWESPWGKGVPGWHLECSVMSLKYLGNQFDIHTGGIDHRQIHHPNEIAQNQAYTCTSATGANWWMHNNFLVTREGKMSKSSGEFATLQSVVDKGVHPLAYRLMCLQAHYRSELEFSGESLLAALTRLKRLVMAIEALRAEADTTVLITSEGQALLDRFEEAVCDDLNVPKALPILDEVLATKSLTPATRLHLIERMDQVFGLQLDGMTRTALRVRPVLARTDERTIAKRLAERQAARAAKNFGLSDSIRDNLAVAGVDVMDGDPLGWDWKLEL
jgi:cysteinyl-tRNA synthetase